jgi:hypothetical protein
MIVHKRLLRGAIVCGPAPPRIGGGMPDKLAAQGRKIRNHVRSLAEASRSSNRKLAFGGVCRDSTGGSRGNAEPTTLKSSLDRVGGEVYTHGLKA